MNKEKHIEEMARDLENHTCMSEFQVQIASRMLYAKGYRLASEVVEEVMQWLEEKGFLNVEVWAIQDVKEELKKKYAEEEK